MPDPHPSPSILPTVLLTGAALALAALLAARQGALPGGGEALATSGLAVLGAVAGFRCGRLMVSGARAGRRRCGSCGARRTGTGAFCESCGWRD